MIQLTENSNSRTQEIKHDQMRHELSKTRVAEIESILKSLGAVKYDFLLPETHALPYIIHPDERIIGIVYGRYKQGPNGSQIGRGALVATNNRVLLIDKKPLFVRVDELTYHVISGVTYSRVGIAGTVSLHTRMRDGGDISVRTFNRKCADSFVEAIEASIFQNSIKEGSYE